MLRLLANENVPRLLIEQLRIRSHDVRWVGEEVRGISDPDVLGQAVAQNRILLTLDKDFGELIFRQGKAASCGVILLRIESRSQLEFVSKVLPVLESDSARWAGHFSVIGPRVVRVSALP